MIILSTYLKSLRPHQWLKNFLIFIPLLAAHNTNLEIIRMAVIIFFSFSLMASSVYIINDIIDLKLYTIGFGVFYRYGPYHLPKTMDNIAFKFTLKFAFGLN